MKNTAIKWLKKPQKHDYPSALSYLSLLMVPRAARKLVAKLKAAEMATFAAKDIFRASRLPLLGANNSHVEKVRTDLMKGEAISPSCSAVAPRAGTWSSPTGTTASARCTPLTRTR